MDTTPERHTWPPKALHEKVEAVRLAAQPFTTPGAHSKVIFARYGVNLTRFCQVLLVLCTDQDVLRAVPIEVRSIMSRLPSPEQKAARSRARRTVRMRQW